ncbi:NB-ARC domain-containing protein [Thioflexithrix psekupsensis]|uniref:AAA+ ATPase domain-containing protein n=1 Tax=Thioflexithrix psekupsensis TaxID=1570016 RepID=A0A251XBR2_9GAMM|nr:NB-ARC domain-containing protein [Thioflexithrix psekupsensis]OUD15520.1 hypothetical protein TPSD3_03090 [Thioflexithrix psekupsensis]
MSDEYTIEQELTLLEQDQMLLKDTLNDQQTKLAQAPQQEQSELLAQIQHTQRELQETENRLQHLKTQLAWSENQKNVPGPLYDTPELPLLSDTLPAFVSDIKARLVIQPSPSEVHNTQKNPLILHAPSGMGKSTIARLIAHDDPVRRNFVSGIFWISLGEEPDLVARQQHILHHLTTEPFNALDSEQGREELRSHCRGRACLIILDNAWDIRDVLAFSQLGQHCQLLITTTQKEVVEYAGHLLNGAQTYALKSLDSAQSFTLLQLRSDISKRDKAIDALVDFSRGIPTVLDLMARLLKQNVFDPETLLHQLSQQACQDLPDDHPCPLMRAMRVSVDALGDESEYYIALAVFADYNRIPLQAVFMFWHYLYHLTPDQSRDFLSKLVARGLIDTVGDVKTGVLTLQVAQHRYLVAEAEPEKLHEHLLAAYRRQCGQHGWAAGPNDGYFFENLTLHLHLSQRHRELKSLLLDFDWIYRKLSYTSLHGLLNDTAWLSETDADIARLDTALQRAADTLVKQTGDIEGIASTLLTQLWVNPSMEIQKLLNHAKEYAHDWQPPTR